MCRHDMHPSTHTHTHVSVLSISRHDLHTLHNFHPIHPPRPHSLSLPPLLLSLNPLTYSVPIKSGARMIVLFVRTSSTLVPLTRNSIQPCPPALIDIPSSFFPCISSFRRLPPPPEGDPFVLLALLLVLLLLPLLPLLPLDTFRAPTHSPPERDVSCHWVATSYLRFRFW